MPLSSQGTAVRLRKRRQRASAGQPVLDIPLVAPMVAVGSSTPLAAPVAEGLLGDNGRPKPFWYPECLSDLEFGAYSQEP